MNVLVVDDDMTNRLVLKAMLDKDNHSVLLAEDGQQAVDAFDIDTIDMVLMDVMMPVMDGYEATRIIKERCGDVFVPVIFITAMTDEQALTMCVDCGGDDFITKPFNRVILRAKISALHRIRALYATVMEQKEELSLHHQRIKTEHELAERIYDSIVGSGSIAADCIDSLHAPAELFSGDVMLAAPTPDGGVNVMVGDVTGHGLSAAICAMPVSEIFYSMSTKGFTLQHIIAETNKRLKELLPTDMFLATAIIHVDAECRSVQAWNGGLPELLLYRSSKQGSINRIESKHLPLGIVGNDQLDSECDRYEMDPGDLIFMYTDGIIEAANEHEEMYGFERLEELVKNHGIKPDVTDILNKDLESFQQDTLNIDDLTFLRVNCDPELLGKLHGDETISRPLTSKTWRLDVEMQADTLRTTDPLPFLMQMVTGIQGTDTHRAEIFTILSELYNNAFDHGILGLDSELKKTSEGFMEYYMERERRMSSLDNARIKLSISHEPCDQGGRLSLFLEDSGAGFDHHNRCLYLSNAVELSGRGIPLVNTLCEELEYQGDGNVVEAKYVWK